MMATKIDKINEYLLTLKQMMREGKFKNNYVNLYKYLVGYSLTHAENENATYWKEIRELQRYFKQAKRKNAKKIFINEDDHWTYIEAVFTKESPGFRELVKLYVPVTYADLAHISRTIFDHLLARKKSFFLKIAHQDRRDNICIWVMRAEMEAFISFLQSLVPAILPAPLFCPEYKEIGVTRELSGSFNEVIADTLFKYLRTRRTLCFADYIQFIETKYEFDSYHDFDKEIVLRSLKCIANDQCPVISNEFNIVDFNIVDEYD